MAIKWGIRLKLTWERNYIAISLYHYNVQMFFNNAGEYDSTFNIQNTTYNELRATCYTLYRIQTAKK